MVTVSKSEMKKVEEIAAKAFDDWGFYHSVRHPKADEYKKAAIRYARKLYKLAVEVDDKYHMYKLTTDAKQVKEWLIKDEFVWNK